MIEKGSKQQRDVARRTNQLKEDIKKLIKEYEKEVGLELEQVMCVKDMSYDTQYDVVLSVKLPIFRDDEE